MDQNEFAARHYAVSPHQWERWILIAVAMVALSACRGLDAPTTSITSTASVSQSAGAAQEAAAPVGVILPHASLPDSQVAQADIAIGTDDNAQTPDTIHTNVAQTARTSRSLSDQTASGASYHVIPAQHQSPATAPTVVPALEATGHPASPPVAQAVTQVTQSSADCPSCRTSSPQYAAPQYSAPQYAMPYPQGGCLPAAPWPQSCVPPPVATSTPWCPDDTCGNAWRPPGIACPWPEDEYICDGGDKMPSVKVCQDWSVRGLELEDTVAHYDTLDGDTHVTPSNRVCLYSPRFASVRKVYGTVQYNQLDRISKIDKPIPVEGLGDIQIATTTVQPVQPVLNHGTAMPSGFLDKTPLVGLENRQRLIGIHGQEIPYEDITDLQRELLTATEKARLAEMSLAAEVWSQDIAVQVVIDNIAAHEDIATTATQSVHIYSMEGKPRLRICKLASRKEAAPGEIVEFTLQFENIGDQTIGNVTVIDNLTTRLEYVEASESCSLAADFSTAANQGESETLRWEITKPMKVGEGGVIRFKCRVR